MSFSDFSKVETIKSLNDFLADKSYIDGYVWMVLISGLKNFSISMGCPIWFPSIDQLFIRIGE